MFKNILVLNSLLVCGFCILLAYTPAFLDINPLPYRVVVPEKFEKGLAYNERLSAAEPLLQNQIVGPESVAFHKGSIYTGLHNGDIIKIENGRTVKIAELGKELESRPLGLRFNKNGLLYFADALNGLRTLDFKTGKVTTLLAHGTEVNGRKINFPDDLDISDDGIVYMSDASTRWNLHQIVYVLMEHDNSGRVIAYDTKTGKASVLIDNLHMANGVQLTHDKRALLVAECMEFRVIKYHLEGPKKGQKEVFANLPGEPDNIRLSKRGGYWVAFSTARNATTTTVIDALSTFPLVRKVLGRFIHLIVSASGYVAHLWPSASLEKIDYNGLFTRFILKFALRGALVVELNEEGEIVQSLHSSDQQWAWISEVLEEDGYLYLGSFINPYLGKVKL